MSHATISREGVPTPQAALKKLRRMVGELFRKTAISEFPRVSLF